jgi:hypothetical protein
MKANLKAIALYFQEIGKITDPQSAAGNGPIIPKLDSAAMRRIAERVMRSAEDMEEGEDKMEETEREKEDDDEPS